ncbi:hypothetical protein GC173_18260 [bacterium]|nr:hypothetical protein [bacterium]
MRLCVMGIGPYPTEPGAIATSPAIRTRLFVEALKATKYEIVVVLLEDAVRKSVPIPGVAAAVAVTPEDIMDPERLGGIVELGFLRAVFGVGSLMPATAACRLATARDLSCWVDLNGDPIAELHAMQLRQGGKPDAVARDHVWKLTREALLRGDMFSAVSGPQRHGLMGQLGLLGRFGTDWEVSRRVIDLPVGVPPTWTEETAKPAFPEALRERGLTESTRYLFFGGSWNVWIDEVAMGRALDRVLEQDPELHIVFAGIPTGPSGDHVRQAILKAIAAHEKRVVELPPNAAISEHELLAWAASALKMDRDIPESETGTRNRLLPMMRWGTHPVTTMLAELETLLVAQGLATGVEVADWERAAKELAIVVRRTPEEREQAVRRGREWLRSITFQALGPPMYSWLAAGAPRWPASPCDGMLDRWAAFPAEPEKLFPPAKRKRLWF